MATYQALAARELVRNQIAIELQSELQANPTVPLSPDLGPHNLPTQKRLPYPTPPPTTDNVIKLGIVGAGMAGIYTAFIIDKLKDERPPVLNYKIEYEILEASTRMGGRCYTYKFSDDPHDYYDPGAMRFPMDTLMDR